MTDNAPEITLDYIKVGLQEELDTFANTVLSTPDDVSEFTRKGGISQITSADLMSLEMDEVLADIEEDPTNSASSIERLAYLYLARMVATRIESGAVLGSRTEQMTKPVKKKNATKTKAAKDAQEKATQPSPPVTEPEVPPAPVAEVLESNQDFLAQSDEPLITNTTADTPPEPPSDDEAVTLNKADSSVLDLL